MSERTVRRWIQRFRMEGFDGLQTRRKPGRMKVTTAQDDERMVALILVTPLIPAVSTVRHHFPALNPGKKTIYRR